MHNVFVLEITLQCSNGWNNIVNIISCKSTKININMKSVI